MRIASITTIFTGKYFLNCWLTWKNHKLNLWWNGQLRQLWQLPVLGRFVEKNRVPLTCHHRFDSGRLDGAREIERREAALLAKARMALPANPDVEILGSDDAKRLSILSLRIGHDGEYFHHNDLFGIQARGGCSCAGPYGHRLLGIDQTKSHLLQEIIDQGWEGLKPGWVRVNFN